MIFETKKFQSSDYFNPELPLGTPSSSLYPSWSMSLYFENILDQIDINILKETVISKIPEISRMPIQDFYKYALINVYAKNIKEHGDLIGKLTEYNIFKFQDPIFRTLKETIKKSLLNFLHDSKIVINCEFNPQITGWIIVMNELEYFNRHIHGSVVNNFVSGTLQMDVGESSTVYEMPYTIDLYERINTSGELTLFPSYLPHWTTPHSGSKQKISTAFDVYLNKSFLSYSTNNFCPL